MTPVEAVSPPIGQHRVCSNYNAGPVMSLEKEVQEAVGDLLNRLRGSIESELTDVVKSTHGEQAANSSRLSVGAQLFLSLKRMARFGHGDSWDSVQTLVMWRRYP